MELLQKVNNEDLKNHKGFLRRASLTCSSTEITVGKVIMCNKEVFKKNVDVCMMIHPSALDTVYHHMLAVDHVSVEFFGKPSHAAGKDWFQASLNVKVIGN